MLIITGKEQSYTRKMHPHAWNSFDKSRSWHHIEQKRNRFCFRHRPDKRYSNKHKSNVFGTEDANMSGIYQIIAYVQNRLK